MIFIIIHVLIILHTTINNNNLPHVNGIDTRQLGSIRFSESWTGYFTAREYIT